MIGYITDNTRTGITSTGWWNISKVSPNQGSALLGWNLGQINDLLEMTLPISRQNPDMDFWSCLTMVDIDSWIVPEEKEGYPLWRYDVNIDTADGSIGHAIMRTPWVTPSMVQWVQDKYMSHFHHDFVELFMNNTNPIYMYAFTDYLGTSDYVIGVMETIATDDHDMALKTVAQQLLMDHR